MNSLRDMSASAACLSTCSRIALGIRTVVTICSGFFGENLSISTSPLTLYLESGYNKISENRYQKTNMEGLSKIVLLVVWIRNK